MATGFSRPEVNQHVERVGHLASELERNGVCIVASFVSPYLESRRFVRNICQNYIEVYAQGRAPGSTGRFARATTRHINRHLAASLREIVDGPTIVAWRHILDALIGNS